MNPNAEAAPHPALATLAGSPLALAEVVSVLGEGKRSRVFRVRWQQGDYALKLYDPAACAKHLRRHRVPLARYEYRRNRALYAVPGLQAHVARPIAYWIEGTTQALVQEYVPGQLYENYRKGAAETALRPLIASLTDIIERAHRAGLYDLDLHPNNVMVTFDGSGAARLKLYDFNKIPFHEYSPNPLAGLLLRLGLIQPQSRDLRRLHLFTDPPGRSRLGTRRQ